MTNLQKRACQVLAITALSLGLVACGKNDNQTAGQKLDNAVEQSKQAADQAGKDISAAASTAGEKIEQTAEKAGAATEQALNEAGAAKAGAAIDDAAITTAVKAKLIADPAISALKIDVDTKAGVVTLNGTAPSDAAKEQAAKLAASSENVSSVTNNLTSAP